MQEGAYNDYMRQAAAAGHEAQAAIDVNLTPMEVSGVPRTKADITDFTPVAKGGLMTLPNKQRKRYYAGTDEEEVLDTEEEVLSPFDLQQETGIDLMGEQVKYNTGNPREGAWSVWNSGGIDQEIYDFDFEIFFDSGDWSDMLKGQAPVQENMQMASADPVLQDEYDKYVFDIQEQGGTPISIEQFREQAVAGQANGGIIGLRHGGRPGYNRGLVVNPGGYAGETAPPLKMSSQMRHLKEGNQMSEDAYNEIFQKFIEKFPGLATGEETLAEMVAMLQAEGVMETEDLGLLGLDRSMDMITPESAEKSAQRISMGDTQYGDMSYAQGGRIGYAFGPGPVVDQETMAESITLPDGGEEVVTDSMTEIEGQTAGGGDRGWKAQMLAEDLAQEQYGKGFYDLSDNQQYEIYTIALDMIDSGGMAQGGRIGYQGGGDMAHRLSELIKKSNAGTITDEEKNEMEQIEIMLDYGPGEAPLSKGFSRQEY